MNKCKQIFACALGAAFVFLFAACSDTSEQKEKTDIKETVTSYDSELREPLYQQADRYLLENGYSASFIANTGRNTKTALMQAGAKFESDAVRSPIDEGAPADTAVWEGFSYSLTVSDASAPEDSYSLKYVTFNWAWQAPHDAATDRLIIQWSPNYSILLNSSMLEIFGTGTLQRSYVPDGAENFAIPQTKPGTFLTLYGMMIDQRQGFGGINCGVPLELCGRFSYHYADTLSPEGQVSSANTPYGEYLIDQNNYRGSLTVAIAQYGAFNNINSAVISYTQETGAGTAQTPAAYCNFYNFPQEAA